MNYLKNKDITAEYFEEGGVLYNNETDIFYAMDEMGAEIFKFIEENDNAGLEIILNRTVEQYDVPKDVAEQDINTYLNELQRLDFIIINNNAPCLGKTG